jgi:hypothetical protein
MSNGEGKSHKSLELLIQVSAWSGGILAAAVGGFLIAFGSKDTAPEVLHYFKWAVIPLILALLSTWYVQIHAAQLARELDSLDAQSPPVDSKLPAAQAGAGSAAASSNQPKATRLRSIKASIALQVGFQTLALIMIAVGVYRYKAPAPEPWSLIAHEASDREISYLMTMRQTSDDQKTATNLRLLIADGSGGLRLCTIDPAAKDGPLQCAADPSRETGAPALQLMGDPILFHRLRYKLKYDYDKHEVDLTPDVCKSKQALLKANAGGVLVVGSHDRERIPDGADVNSNESLARLRASSVADYLAESNACGPGVESVISLNAAPVMATRDTAAASDVSTDRSVKVYGLISRRSVR